MLQAFFFAFFFTMSTPDLMFIAKKIYLPFQNFSFNSFGPGGFSFHASNHLLNLDFSNFFFLVFLEDLLVLFCSWFLIFAFLFDLYLRLVPFNNCISSVNVVSAIIRLSPDDIDFHLPSFFKDWYLFKASSISLSGVTSAPSS